MNVKRFEASDMMRALELVRADLGPSAVIISSRKQKPTGLRRLRGGEIIEVIAGLPESDEAEGTSPLPSDALPSDASGGGGGAALTDALSGILAGAGEALDSLPLSGAENASAQQATHLETADGAAALDLSLAALQAAAGTADNNGRTAKPDESLVETNADAFDAALGDSLTTSEESPAIAGDDHGTLAESLARAEAAARLSEGEASTAPSVEETEPVASDPTIAPDLSDGPELNGSTAQFEALQQQLTEMRQLIVRLATGRIGDRDALPAGASELLTSLAAEGVPEHILDRATAEARALLDVSGGPTAAREAIRRGLLSLMAKGSTPQMETDKTTAIHLIGPAGSGKTMAAIKLALRLHKSEGHPVVLANADQDRPGAGAQLAAYAEALNLPFAQIYEPSDLKELVKANAGAAIIVDSPGGLPRTAAALTAQKGLIRATRRRRTLLILDASTKFEDLCQAHTLFAPLQLNGIVLAKADQTERLGAALGLLAEVETPLVFLSDSADVMDELETVGPDQLLTLSLERAALDLTDLPDPEVMNAASSGDERGLYAAS